MWWKLVWFGATVVNIATLIWFFIGATAAFQRFPDLVLTVQLLFFGIPSLFMILISILVLRKGWTPSSPISFVGYFLGVVIMLGLSTYLFTNTNKRGWLTDIVSHDSLTMTSDQKYQYRIELINVFQGNSHARLYVKNVATGKETSIPVEIHTERIKGLSENSRGTHWVQLTPTGTPDRYQLTTTDYLRIPMEKFDIDIGTGTSKRLE